MSTAPFDHACYVHCNYCNTILVVSVPRTNMYSIVTVRCGHCGNLLSVNTGALPHQIPVLQDLQKFQGHNINLGYEGLHLECESSSKGNKIPHFSSIINNGQKEIPLDHHHHSPGKRQRIPSAYNKFIKEEIRRLKATNPDISHREAFSAAAKNWAHFPHIHFGLNIDDEKQVKKIDDPIAPHGSQDTQAYY